METRGAAAPGPAHGEAAVRAGCGRALAGAWPEATAVAFSLLSEVPRVLPASVWFGLCFSAPQSAVTLCSPQPTRGVESGLLLYQGHSVKNTVEQREIKSICSWSSCLP